MDANGSRFHLLQGLPDWDRCKDAAGNPLSVEWQLSPPGARNDAPFWDSTTGDITLQERVFRFPAAPKDVPPRLENRRGAGRDCGGNWYWISDSRRQILVLSSGDQKVSQFWPRPDSTCAPALVEDAFGPVVEPQECPTEDFAGLAVTADHYLVVGSTTRRGLLIFDLFLGRTPRRILWPMAIAFEPWDIAPAPKGGVFVLDREHERYWRLNRHFYVIGERAPSPDVEEQPAFVAVDGSPTKPARPCVDLPIITSDLATVLHTDSAISIEALPDGSVLILESHPEAMDSLIWWYRCGIPIGPPASTDAFRNILEDADRTITRLQGVDFATVTDDAGTRVYVASTDGNQSFLFAASFTNDVLTLQPRKEYLPMRLFAGKALVSTGNEVWYDFPNRWVPLVAQKRKRFEPAAVFFTWNLDGRDPDCVWHRLFVDACIPDGASIRISSRCSNVCSDVESLPWRPEPTLHERSNGSELPFVVTPARPTFELLFQQARGRYLQLRIDLAAGERDTPRIRAMRIYYPRFSYLDHYLPGLYREDRTSASFLDRFLANFEGVFTVIEDRIAAAHSLLDARGATAETLPWLGTWIGILFDDAWTAPKRRLFLQHATEFFAYRATIRGLLMGLRLVWDDCSDDTVFTDTPDVTSRRSGIRIIESFRLRESPALIPGTTVNKELRWEPADGVSALNERYRTAIDAPPGTVYPLTPPSVAAEQTSWQNFSESVLGFTPVTGSANEALWESFLLRRYRTTASLQSAYGTSVVPIASVVPADGPPLQDWADFQRFVLRARDTAHRFTVLLPVRPSETGNSAAQQARKSLVLRILDLEKPAHTVPAVQFYWAVFRAGYVRLGEGTLLGLGSRAPELLSPALLGQAYLSETYLAKPPGRPVLAEGCLS